MKINKAIITLFAFAPLLLGAKNEKIYLLPEQIEVSEEGIFFEEKTAHQMMQAKSLHFDEKGLFVYREEVVWQCPKCGYINRTRHNVGCRRCDWPFD